MKRNLITITYESNIYHKPLERGLYLPTNFKKENVWQLEGSTTKEICEQFCDFNWINEEQPIMKIKIVEWVTDEERQAYKKEALDALEQMKIKNNEQLEYACKELQAITNHIGLEKENLIIDAMMKKDWTMIEEIINKGEKS